jgi:hypothetical protein
MSRELFAAQCREANKGLLSSGALLRYSRDNRKRKLGVVIAFKRDNVVQVGYSKCNVQLEEFDRDIGIAKAIQRAQPLEQYLHFQVPVPNSMEMDILAMCERAARYFKVR